jgi:hypothetical protein
LITKGVVLRVLVAVALSVPLWIACRAPISRAVGGVAALAIRAAGERPYYRQADELGIVVVPNTKGGAYGVKLMRWHVNLIVLPILAAAFGRLTARRRVLLCLVGLPILLLLDGGNVFLRLYLEARRLRGEALFTPGVDEALRYGLAVYGVKLLPVAVWAGLYVALGSRLRGSTSSSRLAA